MGPLVLPHRYLLGLRCFPGGRRRGFGLYLMVSGPFKEILPAVPPSSSSQTREEGREWACPNPLALTRKRLQHRGCRQLGTAQPSRRANEYPRLLLALITFCSFREETFPMGASQPDLLPGPQLFSSLCLRWIITTVGHGHGCKPGSRPPSSWPCRKGWEVATAPGEGCKALVVPVLPRCRVKEG